MKTKKLNPEFQEMLDEFNSMYSDSGCSCHINPPCSHCVHEGNPLNLEETPEAWE